MATTLNRVVVLVPPSFLTNPPAWLTSSFTITPGGYHSNNLAVNNLILFPDGVYIELICFCGRHISRRPHWFKIGDS